MMSSYDLNCLPIGRYQIEDVWNGMLLREDLCSVFDEGGFVFVSKPAMSGCEETGSNYVTHVLQPVGEISQLYHNTSLHSIPHVRPLSRFARTVFPYLAFFLRQGSDRLLVYQKEVRQHDAWIGVAEMISAEDCKAISEEGRESHLGREKPGETEVVAWPDADESSWGSVSN
ncbi:MAG: hypothetical protein M1813_001565 [Trichoglossum hirsutum]|nr:MAG: hypothetical protein M1813_001565 [Trichoglossum hirsutum]